jgi:hypothetical protein
MQRMKPKFIVLWIRLQDFTAIVDDRKKTEYRKDSEFWKVRLDGLRQVSDVAGKTHVLMSDCVHFPEKHPKDDCLWGPKENYCDGCQNYVQIKRVALFMCGPRVHKREITKIEHVPNANTFQVPTPMCYAIHLGEEWNREHQSQSNTLEDNQ